MVELLSKHFLISEKEAMEYLDMSQNISLTPIKEIVKKYGKSDKDVERLFKIAK